MGGDSANRMMRKSRGRINDGGGKEEEELEEEEEEEEEGRKSEKVIKTRRYTSTARGTDRKKRKMNKRNNLIDRYQ